MIKKMLTIVFSFTVSCFAFALDLSPGENVEINGTEVNCKKVDVDTTLPKCNTRYGAFGGPCSQISIFIGDKLFACGYNPMEAATTILQLQRANQCR